MLHSACQLAEQPEAVSGSVNFPESRPDSTHFMSCTFVAAHFTGPDYRGLKEASVSEMSGGVVSVKIAWLWWPSWFDDFRRNLVVSLCKLKKNPSTGL